MTSVPYPTFDKQKPSFSAAVGRCRIHPTNKDESYRAIVAKCVEQGNTKPTDAASKKLAKQYMKEGVAMASAYLREVLLLDVSVIDVEVMVDAADVVSTSGCLASCLLDAGCARIVLPPDQAAIDAARIPRERLMLHTTAVVEASESFPQPPEQLVASLVKQYQEDCESISVFVVEEEDASEETLKGILATATDEVNVVLQLRSCSAELMGRLSQSTPSHTSETTISLIDPTAQELGLAYAACCKTDRADGLYSTVVCTRSGEALGLVYSSKESIVAALECGRGVYYSRSRNSLWRKGDTSGHYQTLHRIDVDCDGDALRFTVTQQTKGDDTAAFCHLNTLTCWGPPRGVRHLEETLAARLKSAPEGSYTKRLFEDEALLQSKLVEEAQELSEADTPQHVAEELADVLYFAMVRAAKAGVSVDDAAAELDRRTRKVTRRQGDAKAHRIAAGQAILEKAAAKSEQTL